ncbi:hypothetical protein CDL15_Pgr010953 [Punica granatum]|uniref:Uncharacterized protein n=1 Tax=Punica granatum TaxID=22663 RepID=A0A218XN83_PUNGR|nr:hypothetical protein CDL15_Pgr010953 [Punica granatum]
MVKVMLSRSDTIGFCHKVRDALGDESLELHLFHEAVLEFRSSRDHSVFVDKVTMLCIKQIYSEQGLEIVNEVHKKPMKALPVVLRWLEQREAEWVEFRSEMNKSLKQFHQSRSLGGSKSDS